MYAIRSYYESLKAVKANVEGGSKLGEEIGKRLKEKKIDTVVFDRNGYKYHGIVKAIADGARNVITSYSIHYTKLYEA